MHCYRAGARTGSMARRFGRWLAWGTLLLGSVSLAACTQQAPQTQKSAHSENETKDDSSRETTTPLGSLAEGEPESPLPVEQDDARLGSPAAPVTVVAFLDFQCPHCARGFETLQALRREYSSQELRIVFKHLPLESHSLALPAAVAGQAVMQTAGSEAFFEFAQMAFEGQDEMDFSQLAHWARQSGVTQSSYNEGVSKETTLRRVARDAILASRLGVEGTPAFFINGRLIDGVQPLETFSSAIDSELDWMKEHTKENSRQAYAARVEDNTARGLARALLKKDPHDYLVPIDGSARKGPEDALVTIVMFTDYQCPYCKHAERTLEKLMTEYEGQVRLVHKHLPLPSHPMARPAARVAEAVRAQSGDAAFFRLSDEIFDQAPDLTAENLRKLGREFGLENKELDAALQGNVPQIEERLQKDSFLADDVLARGTPHFFINGKRLAGARPLAHFKAIVDKEMARAEEHLEDGVAPTHLYEDLQQEARQPGAPQPVDMPLAETTSPTRGQKDAPVTIHIFSDFQCPYCKRAEQTIDELDRAYPNQLRYVWHNFPLQFHERARPAARAAEEAIQQGGSEAFWQMHDALFGPPGDPPALGREEILEHGREIGLDIPKLKESLEQSDTSNALEEDADLARSLGIRGTPAFVVGEYLVTGARKLDHFKRLIELELSRTETRSSEAPDPSQKDNGSPGSHSSHPAGKQEGPANL